MDPRSAPAALVEVRLEISDRCLHGLCGSENEWELHLSSAEELADGLHPREEDVVDDVERVRGLEGFVQIPVESDGVADDDSFLQPLEESKSFERVPRLVSVGDRIEGFEQHFKWVVVVCAPVVDEIEACCHMVRIDSVRKGVIFPEWMIAASSPASRHSWRNTELRTRLAAGRSPNETFDTPSTVDLLLEALT